MGLAHGAPPDPAQRRGLDLVDRVDIVVADVIYMLYAASLVGVGVAWRLATTTPSPVWADCADGSAARVSMSVGGSRPHVAVDAQAHDDDDRKDDELHDRSLLGFGVVTIDDGHRPDACRHDIPEVRNMQFNSGN
jgi:hypothetical protein